MTRWLRLAFFALVVRPVILLVIGLSVRHRDRLPADGPAIIAANHASHLDTLVLMSLYPLAMLPKLRPVAAADYFLATERRAWFALNIMGIIPIERRVVRAGHPEEIEALFKGPVEALERGEIVILFPEGTRSRNRTMGAFKAGIARIAERCHRAPVVPVFLQGLHKAMPKGSCVPAPIFCDVYVGEPIAWPGARAKLMGELKTSISRLAAEGHYMDWDEYDGRAS